MENSVGEEHLKCPISLEIMSDPVILSSGHTFDRSSIQRWLDSGHFTCPITKLPLSLHSPLIPNYALRTLISTFTPTPTTTTTTTPSLHHHDSLISSLSSSSSSLSTKIESLRLLTRLSHRDPLFRRRITDSGVVPVVLSCVADEFLSEKALSLLLNLSLDDDNKVGLVAEGVVGRVVEVLVRGSSECRAVAATLVTSLAVVEVNKATIGAYPHAVGALVELVRSGKGREKKEGATALYALCSFPDNRRRAVECGAVLVLLRSADSGLERAVEVIGLLSKCKEGREQIEKFDGCVRILVRILRNGSSRGIQYALLSLSLLCCNSYAIVEEAMEEGVFEICVGFLEDDNDKIRRNASNLIHALRSNTRRVNC